MKTKHFYFFVLLTIGGFSSPLLAQQATPQKGSTHIAIKKSRQLGMDGFVWYEVKKGNLYGAEDANGKLILPIKFPIIYYTGKGYFEVGDNKVRGAYSKEGKCLISIEYGSLFYRCNNGLAYWEVTKNEKRGILDVEGKEVFYSDCHFPLIGLRSTYDHRLSSKPSVPYYFYVSEGEKEGLFDLNGIEICPVKYKSCWLQITNNGLELYKDDITQKISYNGETKFNYQPLDQLVVPKNPLYDRDLGNGLYSKYEGDFIVLLDAYQNNLDLASYKYKNVSCLNGDEDVWCLKVSKNKEGGPYGIVDKKGAEIIPPELDEIETLDGNFLKFKINGFWGVMNYQGKIIIPTSRGYTNIGRYIKSQKRFTYEMYGYRGECNHLGQQVSKIKVATEPQQQNSVANNPPTRPSNNQSQNTTSTQQPQKQVIVIEQQRQPVPVQEWVQCNICHNSGTCQVCYGNGYTGFGTTSSVCISCNGRKICSYCAGQGGHYETRYR